jgi:hypothetical protein
MRPMRGGHARTRRVLCKRFYPCNPVHDGDASPPLRTQAGKACAHGPPRHGRSRTEVSRGTAVAPDGADGVHRRGHVLSGAVQVGRTLRTCKTMPACRITAWTQAFNYADCSPQPPSGQTRADHEGGDPLQRRRPATSVACRKAQGPLRSRTESGAVRRSHLGPGRVDPTSPPPRFVYVAAPQLVCLLPLEGRTDSGRVTWSSPGHAQCSTCTLFASGPGTRPDLAEEQRGIAAGKQRCRWDDFHNAILGAAPPTTRSRPPGCPCSSQNVACACERVRSRRGVRR